jgi:hypothetical protein
MVRFMKSLLLTGLLVCLGLANAGCGGDTGTQNQTKKDAGAGMKMMGEKQREMAEKHGHKGAAGTEDADKDKDKGKTEDKKDDKKADDKNKAEDKGKGDQDKKDKK